ncbi:MBL fold metallo-hydrolase [Permianibacter aggregans]|nr:MBL fold metallo-hydrolase [Permianibacter aggregans]QGX38906.1 hypothetical protein E2H98_04190 [Permianibacter aggregans]
MSKKVRFTLWLAICSLLALASLWSCSAMPINQEVKRGVIYEDGRFHSPWGTIDKSLTDVLSWRWQREDPGWPQSVAIEQTAQLPAVSDSELSITYINHATLLIRLNGVTILTDPIYAERASFVSFWGPKRVHPPGIAFDDLPPIDVVVISHNHYDHLDLETLEKLQQRDQPQFFVGLGNEVLLKDAGIERVRPMDWGESVFVRGVKIIFAPAQHWSARGLFDRNKTLWGSFVIMDKTHRIYFGGDSGYAPHFQHIGESYGPFDVALLPIGAYEPRWFMKHQHINPEEAAQAHIDLRAKHSIGMHFDTFPLADEPFGAAGPAFLQQRQEKQLSNDSLLVLKPGESWSFSTPAI